jgi:hypothetical protein
VHLFAGPSLYGTPWPDLAAETHGASEAGAVCWRPPARRGDIDALCRAQAEPGVIALADGTFHAYPSVSHLELREALAAGWQVWGLCSMGAIRACEMAHLGMRPWGRVAGMFCADPDLADDEVALVHGAEHPYLPLSEPLLHLREFLAQMRLAGRLTAAQEAALAHALRERWYGERTLGLLRQELHRLAGAATAAALEPALADFAPFRLKQQDLMDFLADQPWLDSPARPCVTTTAATTALRPS